ncbi:glycoside hydrolase superfamily [Lentinula raphanica]|uniref:Alpha-galactosidase n=1 Tax=Lentinula raphanica TaxID=153919 RepID=A0AA38UD16_9AGAR|nr:glycoside hydrolase superfamily [Lentinula raphanica]KAJ3836910.1 glycoside hydrolase superfamily [Lentinula raphanica]
MYIPRAAALVAATATSVPLNSLTITKTPNGFTNSARGWNSFGIQANAATDPSFVFNQTSVEQQCDVLVSAGLVELGYSYCSLDSGWSVGGNGDENGRIIADSSLFNMTDLASHLHNEGLQLGVYVVPGGFLADVNKTILGTDITIGSVCSGDNGLARCNWNYGEDGVQQWHDSVVALFAEWGVDFIKLDFITPGSPDNGVSLPANESQAVVNYHNAIEKSGRQMRLDISWKLARDPSDFDIWESNADSFRTDQDINNSGADSDSFTAWATVQRAIDNYRQYIVLHTSQDETLSIYPDMDNLYVGNSAPEDGVTDDERFTIMNHWLGAGSNLILGNDLTQLDDTGKAILTNAAAHSVADFAAQHPMRPRNPGTGEGDAQQLQAWIGGPDDSGKLVVILANYGPDEGQGGFNTTLSGVQNVTATWQDLGISGSFAIQEVWKGQDLGTSNEQLSASLDEGQSLLAILTPTN